MGPDAYVPLPPADADRPDGSATGTDAAHADQPTGPCNRPPTPYGPTGPTTGLDR